MGNLGLCIKGSNTLDDLSGGLYVPNNTEDVNVKVLNMIIRINENK